PPRLTHLRPAWERLTHDLGITDERAFADLAAAYSRPERHYHNLDHLAAVLSTVEELREHARHPDAVALAAWFHDAVYDPRAADNEERSAVLADAVCSTWGLPRETVDLVARLVRLTKSHDAPDDDVDGFVLLDADLAILGAPDDEYDRYARAIRQEYA